MEKEQLSSQSRPASKLRALAEVLGVSTRLGLTSFGGPTAHLGYFFEEYVRRRKWLDERSYADLVALCQFLPGPASSQVGIGIGVIRAGLLGGLVAWAGFTLPSVIALICFAFFLQDMDVAGAGWVHGLKIVAVAIVAQAILGMGKTLTPDRKRLAIALVAATFTLLWQSAISQIVIVLLAGAAGMILYRRESIPEAPNLSVPVGRGVAIGAFGLFVALLIALPLLREMTAVAWIPLIDSLYRAGSLVFGGGHVLLPMLEREVVPLGWISREDFLAGYGAAQAVPGPLFTFTAYLGAMSGGIAGGVIATVAIFLPAFLLIIGALPFWNQLRRNKFIQGALMGINAAVVGILLAAWYNPLWTTAILSPGDFALAAILVSMLVFWKLPPWVVVIAGALGGSVLNFVS
ncbi:chromate transporter [Brevibacillus migulae]|uniref:chromate transporter n=1 Tax=Brevibacillus migulae TaxID=1644114 RepID=UPI00106E9930|nr:chromate transporter [Brevibacillus migulae]